MNNQNKNLIMALIIVGIILLLSLTVWVNVDIKDRIQETGNTITVFATGEVYTKPDLVITTFSAITEAKTVAEALSENAEKMNAVISFVKAQGVEDKDLKTTSFNISPRYEWYENEECFPPCPSGKRVLVGYEIRQSLQVKIRDMEKIGKIIEGATDAGANEVSDLQFTVDKEEEFEKQARKEAIEKAKAKAEELASQLGVNLVKIINFSESNVVPYFYGLEKAAAPSGLGGSETPQIETGENKIEVTVTITYEIN